MSECRAEDVRPKPVHSFRLDARREAFDVARQQWPSVRLTFEQFSQHLDHLGYSHGLPAQLDALYLCAACALRMNAACKALDDAYFPALRTVISAHREPSDFADDLLQQMRERLFGGPTPRIRSYRGSGSLASWLRMVACNLAMDIRRTRRSCQKALRAEWLAGAGSYTDEPTYAEPPEASPRIAQTTFALEALLHESVARLSAHDRLLLSLYYFQELGVNEIGERTGFDRSTVYRQLHRAEQRLAQRVASLLRARWRIGGREECTALIREFSGLVNLRSAFREQAPNEVAAE